MRQVLVLLAAGLMLAGCASVSTQDSFLLANLDNPAKAQVLVDKGIEQYHLQLLKRGDLSKIAVVREYFVMALRYDPQDLLAARYRDLVDNFRTTQLSQALAQAQGLYDQQRRSEDEDYAMCLAILTALRLDPSNAAAARLAQQTASIRQTLIAKSLSRGWTSVGRAAQLPSPSDKEAADIDAYQSFTRALTLDPQNASAAGQIQSLKQDLDRLAVQHVTEIRRLLASSRWEEARGQINQLAQTSRRVGGFLDVRVAEARYALDYQWARSLYEHKSYVLANEKINAALRISRTDEARELKSRIVDLAAQEEKKASFETSLQEIDDLIQTGDLAAASGRIEALARRTEDPSKLDQLNARRQKVRSYLSQVYASAVNDYRNENFKDAIDLLRTIVQIDVDYEQAADYLQRATAKERLIEQY